jgi:hypothetical protein
MTGLVTFMLPTLCRCLHILVSLSAVRFAKDHPDIVTTAATVTLTFLYRFFLKIDLQASYKRASDLESACVAKIL